MDKEISGQNFESNFKRFFLHFLKRMKIIFAVLAVFAVAVVCAEEYTYIVPKLPCEYDIKTTIKFPSEPAYEDSRYIVNNLLMYGEINQGFSGDNYMYFVYRSDIIIAPGGEELIGLAQVENGECLTMYEPMDQYKENLENIGVFNQWNNTVWRNREEVKYDDKNCVLYYNNSNQRLYVYKDYPIAILQSGGNIYFDIKWEAPLEKFKMKECEGDFTKTPSAHFSCNPPSISSSTDVASSTQAVAGFVFAVIAASLVALF